LSNYCNLGIRRRIHCREGRRVRLELCEQRWSVQGNTFGLSQCKMLTGRFVWGLDCLILMMKSWWRKESDR